MAVVSLHLLLLSITATAALQWTSMAIFPNGKNVTVCEGEDPVTFPWRYTDSDYDRLADIEWYFSPASGEKDILLANYVPSAHRFLPAVPYVQGKEGSLAELQLYNVTFNSEGIYSVKINVMQEDEPYIQSATLVVKDIPAVQDGRLVAKIYNQTSGSDSEDVKMLLSCGTFTSLGNPPISRESVLWTTESGESFPSDFYEGGLFFFAPPNGTKGNTYNCSIDPSTIPDECSGRELPGNVTLIIDEDIVKLSAVEHRIRHLEAQLREEQTENAAIRHELDIVKGNLTDIISSFTAQLEALRAGTHGNISYTTPMPTMIKPVSCRDALRNSPVSGVVSLFSEGGGTSEPANCDQETDGGGWLIIQRRRDGSVNFKQNWTEYEDGFGNITGEFWIGLKKIHYLTSRHNVALRIDMMDFAGNTAHATYNKFVVEGIHERYRMHVQGFVGTAGNSLAIGGHQFTTHDRDNDDRTEVNCADTYGGGGWWYSACGYANPNGVYKREGGRGWDSIFWFDWKNNNAALKAFEMKIRHNE